MSLLVPSRGSTAARLAAASQPLLPISNVDIGQFSRDLLHGIRQLHEAHGPIAAIQDGQLRVVFLFSAELNQQVLSDTERYHARFFAVRGPKKSAQRQLTCGLLAMNGEQHRRNRRLVKQPFGRPAIAHYAKTVTQLTDEMLDEWKIGETYDVADEMRKYMLRTTSALLFGLNDPEMAYHLGDMIARWVELNDEVGAGALVPNETFTERYEHLLTYAEEVREQVHGMIRRQRESREFGNDVLSILVRARDEEGSLSDDELVGQVSVLFAAAHMTTAHALTWTLFLLAQHRSIMRQLWDEWQRSDAEEPSPLLERVIKESLRLLPASAYSQRINVEPVQLGPFRLPRGTGIVFTPLVTHRLPELYPEPERFIPDRWLTLQPSPYAYHPFGAGARMCIGGPLALEIMRITLRRILTRYRLATVAESDVSAHVQSTMLVPSNGLQMTAHPADGQFSSAPVIGNIRELVDLVEA